MNKMRILTNKKTLNKSRLFLAPRVGFEPTTLRLTAGCSTAELTRTMDTISDVIFWIPCRT